MDPVPTPPPSETGWRAAARGLVRSLAIPSLQPLWEKLLLVSLEGLNVGGGAQDVVRSGEAQSARNAIARSLRRDPGPIVVIDGGANAGSWSEAVLPSIPEGGSLHAFEPARATFATLQARMGGRPRLELHPLGLSDTESTMTLYSPEPGAGVASVYPRRPSHLKAPLVPMEKIQMTTLDAFCEARGIERISLLKLDVEGHEIAVLRGARKLLEAKAIDHIQFEFGPANVASRTFLDDFFKTLDPPFAIHRIVRGGIVPVAQYRETWELFNTTNFLAVRRDILRS